MKQKEKVFRRIASNEVMTPDGQCLIQQVVELADGVVSRIYPLVMEQANTEWLKGRLVLRVDNENHVRAYYKDKPLA